jgi:four helix bundle protein
MKDVEMPIFSRSYDYLSWILPATNHFPRSHRHSFTHRLLEASFDLRERLEAANLRQGKARLGKLILADESLSSIRVYIRLAERWKWLGPGQYEHVSQMTDEIGRLLGGWKKATMGEKGQAHGQPGDSGRLVQ